MAEATICRLCAVQKDSFIGIYEEEGQKLMLDRKIIKCLQIELYLKDPLPKTVCLDCCAKLKKSSDFYDESAEAQVTLFKLFQKSREERSITSSDRQSEHHSEDFLSGLILQQHGETDDYSKNEETEGECDPLENRSSILANCLAGFYDPEFCSKRKRRVPLRVALQTTTVNHCEELSSKHLSVNTASPRSLNQNSDERKVEANMEDLDKTSPEETETEESLTCGSNLTEEDPMQTTCDSGGDTVSQGSDSAGGSPRKRRDGWEKYPWMCTDCSQELPSMQALRTHHQTVHNQPPRFMCAQCSKVYTKYYGFVSHVRRHRNHMKFCCEECGKCFSNKKVLESHRATHSDARPFVCSECGKSFRQQSALYVHNRSHMPESVKNRYPCDQCDKRFSTKPNLVTHKRIHTGIRNFTCDQCGKSFIQKGNLDAHLLTHSADKPHLCPVCNKGFKTPLQLRKHQTVHTGAKPHQCDVCGRQFRERGTLREHHRIHTGAMPFTCEFCGKSFRFKGILTTHRRQHTGERPYSCLECQHHFTNWPNYNKHMKRRHGINTSIQPDPNKIALANMAAANAANVAESTNSSMVTSQVNTPTAAMLVIQHQPSLHVEPHQQAAQSSPDEHCQSILGLPADLLQTSSLTSGTVSVEFNHSNTNALSAHATSCDQPLHVSAERLISGAPHHFYSVTSATASAPPPLAGTYVTATPAASHSTQVGNVLNFYALPHQLAALEGPPLDLLSPVQQR